MDFIREMIARDLASNKYDGRVVTRFPPEPNGFLHIGHAKSICLNFGIAAEHTDGRCHLRLDDTNPDTERAEFVQAMQEDIRWLGFDWDKNLFHASDYFEQLYRFAHLLIGKGLAYVDSSSEEEIREARGSVTEPGRNSPWRNRSIAENRELFERMRAGDFSDGAHVLRAKIDMSHPNMVMRDPVLYRIRHSQHYRHGDSWPIFPLYDFAHCLSDSLERVTHSLCTLEFDNNREIYDWLLEHVDAPAPRPEQTEFAPLVLDYVVTSKRKLRQLVDEGHVGGWDDPRLPTLAGLRRRGVTPAAIRALCEMVGVSKAHSRVGGDKLDYAIRSDLESKAPRAFCVTDPLKVVLTNYPKRREESFAAPAFPQGANQSGTPVGSPAGDQASMTRDLPFGRVLYIERSDFNTDPPPGFRRLTPGGEVRLKYAYVIRCDEVVTDSTTGQVSELYCTVDLDSRGGSTADGRKVAGTIHWLAAKHALPTEVRIYDRLFTEADPLRLADFREALNPDSVRVVAGALVEPGLAAMPPGTHCQFERLGYFFTDPADSTPERLVFNRTVPLRDSWAKKKESAGGKVADSAPRATTKRRQEVKDHKRKDLSETRQPRPSARSPKSQAYFAKLVREGVSEAAAAGLASSEELRALFEAAVTHYPDGARSLALWTVNEVAGLSGANELELARLTPAALADMAQAVDKDVISHRQGRRVLTELLVRGGDFEEVCASLDLTEIRDEDALTTMLQETLKAYPEKVAAYRGGKSGLMSFFVGQVMKRTQGQADPREVSRLASELLDN